MNQLTNRQAMKASPFADQDFADCPTCDVPGCVCEWCDDCGTDVNPYIHFSEWNPAGGVHVSDGAIREQIRIGLNGGTK
jgi:hypothetical protein